MSRGESLYLIMCLVVFTIFAITLAWQSWLQGKTGPEALPEPESHRGHHTGTAHA